MSLWTLIACEFRNYRASLRICMGVSRLRVERKQFQEPFSVRDGNDSSKVSTFQSRLTFLIPQSSGQHSVSLLKNERRFHPMNSDS